VKIEEAADRMIAESLLQLLDQIRAGMHVD
jgi:hypothetical protein